ncbi:hypothetical protein ACCO45_012822 [Purpureocillium lilacinum]|uniref:Uncharacterized protein n=1 Tax=Purpureocillium lilacinum TaxID=33203 RepID=A0ACC4D987_PURLI
MADDYQPDPRPPTLEHSSQEKRTVTIPERTEEDDERVFRLFRGWTVSERDGQTRQWVYRFGYDIQNVATKERRWVCFLCVKRKDPKPKNYNHKGLQNAESHLFKDHDGMVDPSGKWLAVKSTASTPARSIATLLRLNPEVPRDQEITNLLIKRPRLGREGKRNLSDDVVAMLEKRRKFEDESSKSEFEWEQEQTPDPHVGEEFWVTGRCCDYNEPSAELAQPGCMA